MSEITTHVLDTSRGRPAVGFQVGLQVKSGDTWKTLGAGLTDANGRCTGLLGNVALETGTYRLLFNAGAYYRELHVESFYSEIAIVFGEESDSSETTITMRASNAISPFSDFDDIAEVDVFVPPAKRRPYKTTIPWHIGRNAFRRMMSEQGRQANC